MRTCTILAAAFVSIAFSAGCEPSGSPNKPSSNPAPAPSSTAAPAPSTPAPADQSAAAAGDAVNAAGVVFTVPEGWKQVPPANQMRLAELVYPDPSGDAAKACTVAVSTAGGDIPSNIARWENQMKDASGNVPKAQTTTKDVNGWKVHTVEIAGSYQGMSDPAPMPNWMMRAAIVETGGETLFIKMTGPADTMQASTPGWNALVESIRKP